MTDALSLGLKIRSLRRRENLTQAKLAERLGISPTYLNLIENNKRSLSAPLLIKLAQIFDLNLKSFAPDEDERTVSSLLEMFGDPLFDSHELTAGDIRELAGSQPIIARALLTLYHSYQGARESLDTLATKVSDDIETSGVPHSRLSTEEVSELIQRHLNYFPELEAGAEALRREARLDDQELFQGLEQYLERSHGIRIETVKVHAAPRAVRRFDPEARTLSLSEMLRRGSRNFQVAHVVGLVTQSAALNQISQDQTLTTPESRALCRVVLANYFAAAVLMPYAPFLEAARSERYDVELLGHRFRTSLEQVCHRLTTLRRPGAEGVPFHMVRTDIAGNISKRFSASGMRFARFSGGCPRWNVFAAFMTPGRFRVQLSRMPEGTAYFDVARTLQKESAGYNSPQSMQAISLGCEVGHARELVYADGIHLENLEAAVPIGVTCRLCDWRDCKQRAFPQLQHPLTVDENVRGVSFYTPVDGNSKSR